MFVSGMPRSFTELLLSFGCALEGNSDDLDSAEHTHRNNAKGNRYLLGVVVLVAALRKLHSARTEEIRKMLSRL
jgi:hypothetical protein